MKQIVRYELTIEDIVAFNEQHTMQLSRRNRRKNAVIGSIVVGLTALLGSLPTMTVGLWCPPVLALAAVLLYNVLFTIRFPRLFRRAVRKRLSEGENKTLIGEHILEVD